MAAHLWQAGHSDFIPLCQDWPAMCDQVLPRRHKAKSHEELLRSISFLLWEGGWGQRYVPAGIPS